VSKIYTALRAIELDQSDQQSDEVQAKLQSAATAADVDEFAVLREFTAPGTLQIVTPLEGTEEDPPQAASETQAVSADGFSELETRLEHVADVVRQERQDRMAAEERAVLAEAQVSDQALRIQTLSRQLDVLRNENQDRRRRVRRMVELLDSVQA